MTIEAVIAIATVSGLIYLAFHHPTGYQKLQWIVMFIIMFLYTCYSFYDFGVDVAVTHMALHTEISEEIVTETAAIKLNNTLVNTIYYGVLIALAIIGLTKYLKDKE